MPRSAPERPPRGHGPGGAVACELVYRWDSNAAAHTSTLAPSSKLLAEGGNGGATVVGEPTKEVGDVLE
jgi:hypothetical protein